MNGKPTTYIINFFAEGVDFWTLNRHLHDSRDIIAYWNYIPLVYCVKSYLSATELAAKLQPYFPRGGFMIAEINANNMNGILPPEAWSWFYIEHHEKREPPLSLGGMLGTPPPFSLAGPYPWLPPKKS
jgi:hypothetical protein